MMKPVEAIERMRKRATRRSWREGYSPREDGRNILAYLDSIQEWPADLDYTRMMELADGADEDDFPKVFDALHRLTLLAPKREKRKVNLWRQHGDHADIVWAKELHWSPIVEAVRHWERVGEAEIDA